jgi:hypothetical protein
MLTENQTNRVWEKMIAAEVRSLYFGDLATRYTRRKQVITGLSFFLSSGAVVTLATKMELWIPLVMSAIAAALTACSIAIGLDKAAPGMAKLHYTWNHLAADFERLWNHWHEDDAEAVFQDLLRRAREASQISTEAPYDERLIAKWEDRVLAQYGLAAA